MTEDSAGNRRWLRAVAITVGIVAAVFVLFTWVFPWVTEMGLSPTME